ncbi:MAG: radical SAM protein [Desulfobacteraceae bacterium]|nr:radical SAM protein [Desulfobacteraceae bacterium]
MQICSIKDFAKRIRKTKIRQLSGVSMEMTRKCNFACKHCFCANPSFVGKTEKELEYKEWEKIAGQIADEGVLFLTITGGEPLLSAYFKKKWIELKKKGFLLTLFTNGSLINNNMVDFFSEWTPLEVSITLYGASEETYQKVTGCKGMFKKVMDALDLISDCGIPLEVKGVFSHLNIHDFEAVKEISKKYCELFRWDVQLIGAFSGISNNPQQIRLSPEEIVELENTDPVRKSEMQNLINRWSPSKINKENYAFGCNVGNGTAHIDAYGYMHPCLPLEILKYDLTKGSVKEGWEIAIPEMLNNLPFQPGPCQACEAIEICSHCAAFALLEGCSTGGPVPFKCELTKARIKKYGISDKVAIPA